MNCNLLAALNC